MQLIYTFSRHAKNCVLYLYDIPIGIPSACKESVSAQSLIKHAVMSAAARTDAATPSKALLLSMDPERRKKDAAALVLQRLLRGRAAQTRMYEGLQSRIALIRVSSSCEKMERKEKTTPFGVNLMRSQALYQAVQVFRCSLGTVPLTPGLYASMASCDLQNRLHGMIPYVILYGLGLLLTCQA